MEVEMKKITFLLVAVLLTASLYAQDRVERLRDINSISIDGILKLERGLVAVDSGESVYFVPLLTRYIGFISELKEGEMISVEGYVFRNVIHPNKVIINDKTYDFPSFSRSPGIRHPNFERRQGNERLNDRPNERPNVRPERPNMPERPGRPGRPA
jgi:hypothetical protein